MNEYVSVQQPDKQTFRQFLDIIKDEEVSGKCSKCAFVDAAEKEVDRLRQLVAEDEARLNHAEKEVDRLTALYESTKKELFTQAKARDKLESELAAERERVRELEEECKKYQQWVDDCQADMYINCVYCGHRYGPDDEVPATMADALKEHIEQCPKHPMSKLKAENATLRERLKAVEK